MSGINATGPTRRERELEAENARLAQTVEELREAFQWWRSMCIKYPPGHREREETWNDLYAKLEALAASEPEAKTVTDQLGNRFHRLTASEPEAEQGE